MPATGIVPREEELIVCLGRSLCWITISLAIRGCEFERVDVAVYRLCLYEQTGCTSPLLDSTSSTKGIDGNNDVDETGVQNSPIGTMKHCLTSYLRRSALPDRTVKCCQC
jgi:hypothetical protein